jgi:hypothetical protein
VSFNKTLSSIVSVVTFLIIFSYFTPLIGAQSNDISTDPKPYGKPLEEWLKNIGNGILGCHQEISPKMLILVWINASSVLIDTML